MVTPSGYRKTVRQTALHQRAGAMHAADMVELSYWDTIICFHLLFSEAVKHPVMLLEYGEEGAADGDSEAENEARFMEFGIMR
ncbi:unnamed protein product [Ectocarpus sp. CCAP 1310/34]|nr:unnamed protein product [Ectocarpus sp. CCAP 1310/34]